MTDYIVVANKLNFRAAPKDGAVLGVLPRGSIVSGQPVAGDGEWLAVTALVPQALTEQQGYVAAVYVEAEGSAPKSVKLAGVAPAMAQLLKFSTNGKPAILEGIVAEFPTTGASFGLTKSKLVMCHFLAQACHESANFHTTREYWGPTKAQLGYEGRADLGNVKPGDGKRYMGRGIFQLTGRSNYRTMSSKLGIDIEADPLRAEDPPISFRIACHYWASRGIGKWAEANDIVKVTRLINGGTNGLSERKALFAKAMKIF
jgi:putative chitinase